MKLRAELTVVSSGPTTAIESEDAAIAGGSLARMRKILWISHFQFDALAFQVVGLVRCAKL